MSNEARTRYIEHLCSEIRSYKKESVSLDTVFFGGGTPSLLTPSEICMLMDSIEESFSLSDDTEFTVEVNPATLTEASLDAFISRGANRFSIGLQSIHENELKKLGRIHTYEDFLSTYKMLRDYGIQNISIDLMFGIPEQTIDTLNKTLDAIFALDPEHISAYGLIIEEGTPFFKAKNTLPLPTEDEEREMYFHIAKKLKTHGYEHYEISNFGKPRRHSRHNLKYWRCEEYIGVGLSAHSYYNGVRAGNSRDINEYYQGKGRELTHLTYDDTAFEFVMLALRLSDGFSLDEYKTHFGKDFLSGREEKLSFYRSGDFLKINDGRLFLTEKGFYVSNTIISDLLL